jgi:transcriptional regulator with XRE-family HTH domain
LQGRRERHIWLRVRSALPVSQSVDRQVSAEHVALGHAIRALRRPAGLSQDELAQRCGLHRTYIGGIERGERNPSFANLLKIARALQVRPSELLAQAEALIAATSKADDLSAR